MRDHGAALPPEVAAMLREFAAALTKAGMYPPGHRFAQETAERLADQLAIALETRGTITLGFAPRSLMLDGTAVEPLPAPFRQFSQRLHRKNIGTIHLSPGIAVDEVGEMLAGLAAADAEEHVGRDGLQLAHVRVEPLTYDVLAFGDIGIDEDLEEIFWARLVEAAFGHRLAASDPRPTAGQLAQAITERAAEGAEGARRVYEALAAFSTALHARGDRNVGSARRRFVEVLTALSRPTTTRIMSAAPSRVARRRFMRETLEQVPPVLLMQLLESVAEADEDPISDHLRWLLTKLAGAEANNRSVPEGHFATEVMALLEQWDGIFHDPGEEDDRRLAPEPPRVLALGLELAVATEPVLVAAEKMSAGGHLAEVLKATDTAGNDAATASAISSHVLDEGLLARLLAQPTPDWALVERIAEHRGAAAVDPLLDAMELATNRGLRRRLLDLMVRLGPRVEAALLDRLDGASWQLARNILAVLAQWESVSDIARVEGMVQHPEPRVRIEAMRVLLRDARSHDRAVSEALESGDEHLTRIGLAALEPPCPPTLLAPVLAVLAINDEDVRLQAIRLVAASDSPLVVPPLLDLVRDRSPILRRWKLRPRSDVSFAALEVLMRRWGGHRPVRVVAQLVARSDDPEIRALVRGAR